MRVYISGAITGRNREEYMRHFKRSEMEFKKQGYEVINPAEIAESFPNTFEHQDYMDIDLILLSKCDIIYMLKGWQQSKGARMELSYAVDHGMTIMEEGHGF